MAGMQNRYSQAEEQHYLLFAFIWASGFGWSGFFVYSAHKAMFWLGVEGNCALGKLFNPYGMVPLGRQHILEKKSIRL